MCTQYGRTRREGGGRRDRGRHAGVTEDRKRETAGQRVAVGGRSERAGVCGTVVGVESRTERGR